MQQAHAATIEEVEEENDPEEYKQEEITDRAARTTRLSDMQRESLMHEMANASPKFLNGPQQMVMLRALFPQAVFIPNQ